MNRAETQTGIFWIEDGILRCEVRVTERHDHLDAQENVRVAMELSAGRRLPMLLDMRRARELTREARVYYASEEGAHLAHAVAMLIDSPFGVVLGNFFIRVNRPAFPVRIFRDEAEAIRWLRSIPGAPT
jgi:hypothetical protein